MFTNLTRTEGKGAVYINAELVVAVFSAQAKTVIRTAAGGENTSFVVSELADDVVKRLSAAGATFITFTRRKDGGAIHFNAKQVVGIYQRADATVIRTTAGGEHAEFVVPESITAVEGLLNKEAPAEAPAEKSLINSFLSGASARKKTADKQAAS
ncbi:MULTISPECIES: hypothetical protein [unclassified Rhizobium]|uniref:hypothetical protein n=1 Tax=unclassified Rhizobium TaxID=2613769 RepID=UPI000712C79C|nr:MULTISPECIES: hypothetical protein [unclassified Rhizobium]KQS90857.1 hypothetical protein ASG42_10130 [Rhizobium sp. Leaf391]KQS95945.1 hypothetical protein ASG50_02350 [Rhizobium sp. Leaf386]